MAETKDKPCKILIVDDDESERNALQDFLLKRGWQASTASSISNAFKRIVVKREIDIVIISVNRPVPNELQLISTSKNLSKAAVIVTNKSINC